MSVKVLIYNTFSYASFFVMYLIAVLMYGCGALFLFLSLSEVLRSVHFAVAIPIVTIPKHLIFGNIVKLMFCVHIIS